MGLSRTLRGGGARNVWLACSMILVSPALALDASSEQGATGVWRLSADGGARACTVQLRAEAADGRRVIGVPPGCRHAMPAIARAAEWSLPAADHIDFADRGGETVLSFAGSGGELTASGPKGEVYTLSAANEPRRAGGHAAASATASHAAVVPAAELPGRYSVLRDINKDTGCMLTLQPGGRAQLAPACRDNGFVIFDPVGWSYAAGRLTLRARKGHHASFEYNPADSSWQKDAKEGGKKLGFRKM